MLHADGFRSRALFGIGYYCEAMMRKDRGDDERTVKRDKSGHMG